MYKLTLTKSERAAFDWVGGRYATGADVFDVLCKCLKDDEEWGQDGDITFHVPEHMAWEIRDLAEREQDLWPCFDGALRSKMQAFCNNIV